MAEQEKKQRKNLSREQIEMNWEFMKKVPFPTDFDELETPLSKELTERLKQVLRRKRD